jgi:hypothetical protein
MIRNIFKSSAKSKNSEKRILSQKLLNNTDPKVEPCGNPDSIKEGEQHFSKVQTTVNLNDT